MLSQFVGHDLLIFQIFDILTIYLHREIIWVNTNTIFKIELITWDFTFHIKHPSLVIKPKYHSTWFSLIITIFHIFVYELIRL